MKLDGPTAAELDKAKGYYAGSYPFKLQTAAGVAQALVAADLHGLGAGYVRELPLRLAAVDEAAAKAAAGALLQPDAMQVVIVGKAAAIEPQIADKGIAYEKIGFKDPISAAARAAAEDQEALSASASARCDYDASLRSASQRPKNASA